MGVKTRKKLLLVITLVLVVVGGSLVLMRVLLRSAFRWYYPIGMVEITAKDLERGILVKYIQKNGGKFPISEGDLIQQGFLKKTKVDDEYEYSFKLGPDDWWDKGYHKRPDFKFLKISYGLQIENINRVGKKLYDKTTGEQILFIDGPHKRWLQRKCYEPISLRLYKLMLEEKQRVKTSQEAVNGTE